MDTKRPAHKQLSTVFGGIKKEGKWRVPRKLDVNILFGGAKLDLSQVDLPKGVTEFSIRCFGGGVSVIVKPGVIVETDGFALLGGFNDDHDGAFESADGDDADNDAGDEQQVVLRLTGFTVMAGLDVKILEEAGSERAQRRKERKRKRRRGFGIRIEMPN